MAEYSKKVWTIPNIMSMFRIILIIPIVITYIKELFLTTIILVAISALTDVTDGIIARKFNMVSEVGKILDPIADKLTQLALMICLCFRFPLIIIPCAILVIKELSSGIIGITVVKQIKHSLDAKWHGKASTVFLYGTMLAHLVWPNINPTVSLILIIICSALLSLSFVLYLIRYIKIIRGLKENAKNIEETPNN